MEMSIDRPEIMQIHRFMKHSSSSFLDLQFVLPETATQAKDIQKTIIFVTSTVYIWPIITVFQEWMKKKGFPEKSSKWIRPYYSFMSDYTKAIVSKDFGVDQENNTDCTILVATDAYDIAINNPDIKLVIQWDIILSFESMIRRMGRAGRNGAQSTFVLFTPNWSRIDDSEEIEKRSTRNPTNASVSSAAATYSQLSNSNRPRAQNPSPVDDDVSDSEYSTDSEIDEAGLISSVLATEADQNRRKAKKDSRTKRTNAENRAKLPDEIFYYINAAQCRRLFALACFDDLTYADHDGSSKPLPTSCCNGPGCLSPEPDFMHRKLFIDVPAMIEYTEADREWIACRFFELKRWRKENMVRHCSAEGIKQKLPDTLLMSDTCLPALAISGGSLNHDRLVQFLRPWPQLRKYPDQILICLQQNRPPLSSLDSHFKLPSAAERKAVLKSFRTSEMLKHMDNPAVAKEARINNLRDKWLLGRGKATPEIKARMRKAAKAEKRLIENLEKLRVEGSMTENQVLEIKRHALGEGCPEP